MVQTGRCKDLRGVESGRRTPKELLELALEALRAARLDEPSAGESVAWMRRYILFHDKRHPGEIGIREVDRFLGSADFAEPNGLARRVEAERALRFLYKQVLGRRWPQSQRDGVRRRRNRRKPST